MVCSVVTTWISWRSSPTLTSETVCLKPLQLPCQITTQFSIRDRPHESVRALGKNWIGHLFFIFLAFSLKEYLPIIAHNSIFIAHIKVRTIIFSLFYIKEYSINKDNVDLEVSELFRSQTTPWNIKSRNYDTRITYYCKTFVYISFYPL
jgi:hypothetical protein